MRSQTEITAWARRYRTALRRFLRQVPATSPAPAERLGRLAADLGLETLVVAGIHERALKTMEPPEDSSGNARREMIGRAETFFKETIVPIEARHPAARQADTRIDRLTRTLRRRKGELSDLSDQLKQATARRQAAEAKTGERESQHGELLAEAQLMQKRLQDRMRGILMQQEGERKRIGVEMRDEIGQALIAINLSLLTLNTAGQGNVEKIEKSIAGAQRILIECDDRETVSADGTVKSSMKSDESSPGN